MSEDKISKFNKLLKQQMEVEAELKSCGGEARLGLLKLYEYPNMQVKLQAARET